jgi:hypothetical protein
MGTNGIDIAAALQWLNWEYPSEISDTTRYWIGRMMDPSLPTDECKAVMADLIKLAMRLPNPLEQAEILVYCGAQGYQVGEIEDAAGWLTNAAEIYEFCHDPHRRTTALWMLYIVQRGRGKYRQAFIIAKRARRLFNEQLADRVLKKNPMAESWYRGRIVDMTVELITSPEDMYECLFEFQGSNLTPSVAEIRDRISFQLEKRDFTKTNNELQLLLGITLRSPQSQETAEAMAFCGVVSWVREDKKSAVSFFRSAMSQYIPSSFEYAVLQWMLGLGLFAMTVEVFSAIQQMETSIQSFEQLRKKAIHENKLEHAEWFASYREAMKRVLRTMVEGTKV